MAKGPKHEPEVTDLARYRKARAEAAKRKQPPPPRPPRNSNSFLGSNPRAPLILAVVAVVLLALWLGPLLLSLL